jgi:methylglutaconyl-CoA hydratase
VNAAALVTVEARGAHRLLTLNRPEVKNALSPELVVALKREIDAAGADAAVRGVVLTGAGPDFCAGADLKVLQLLSSRTREENLTDSRQLARLFTAIHTCPKPVVAAVRGFALAGGSGLACVCDRVVAAPVSTFGFTEARIGFVAAIVSRFLIDRVGMRVARELLLTARRLDAKEAAALGIVDEVAPADGAGSDVVERALAWLATLAPCAPASLALTKKLLAGLAGRDLASALEFAAEMNAETRATADCKEGVAAFLEKRKPKWLAPGS